MKKLIFVFLVIMCAVIPVYSQEDPILKTQEKLIVEIKELREVNGLLGQKIAVLEETSANFKKVVELMQAQNGDLRMAITLLTEKEANYLKIIENKDKEIALLNGQVATYQSQVKSLKRKNKIYSASSFVLGVFAGSQVRR